MRLHGRLFRVPDPEAAEGEFTEYLNPESLTVVEGYIEPSVLQDPPDTRYQFERLGYFWPDPVDSGPGRLVFNRIVALRDSWTKAMAKPRDSAKVQPKAAQGGESKPKAGTELTPEQQDGNARLVALGVGEAEATVLVREPRLAAYLEEAARYGNAAAIAIWVVNDLGPAIRAGDAKVSPTQLAAMVELIQTGTINGRIAKDVLAEALETGAAPVEIVETRGLRQISDAGAIEPIVDRLVAENPDKVRAFRGGKTALAGFFVGQVMRETQGRANPQLVQDLVARKLGRES